MTQKRFFSGMMLLLTAVLLITTRTNVQAAPTAQGGLVTAEGMVIPLFDVNLSFQTGGTVAEILVSEGDTVSIGEALIRLESDDAELAVQQAEAGLVSAQVARDLAQNQLALAEAGVETAQTQVESAEANLALIIAGPRPEEIAAAEAAVAAAQSQIQSGRRPTGYHPQCGHGCPNTVCRSPSRYGNGTNPNHSRPIRYNNRHLL